MLSRFFPSSLRQERSSQLPKRRWRIRAPRTFLWGVAGALAFALGPFLAWWVWNTPLWYTIFPMILGWLIALPRTLYLGLDDRGMALIIPGWTSTNYLWIPQDRLVRLEIRQGWLMATGTTVEQQGNLNWLEAAQQAGAVVPPWVNLHFQSHIGGNQIATPIYLLDRLTRDEIELWLYRQAK